MNITFLSYNIRHCLGINGRLSLSAVAGSIIGAGADVAGLQEVDVFTPRSSFVHQARELGRSTGMNFAMGANLSWLGIAGFGNAVLSRFCIMSKRNYPLPRLGEKRGLQRTELFTGTFSFAFYNTHLGLDRDERLRQVDRILAITGEEKLPLVLAGDFNALTDAVEIRKIREVFSLCDPLGLSHTFPAPRPQYKIDYIFFSSHWKPVQFKVFYSEASDHLPLVAKLKLVRAGPVPPSHP